MVYVRESVTSRLGAVVRNFAWQFGHACAEFCEPGHLERTFGTPDRLPRTKDEGDELHMSHINRGSYI